MFNKLKLFMIIMVVLLALPVMASASYYVNPVLQPILNSDGTTATGGSIVPADLQYVALDPQTVDFDITPTAGYEVARITLNGVTIYNGDGGSINTGNFHESAVAGTYTVTANRQGSLTNMLVTFKVPQSLIYTVSRVATGCGAIRATDAGGLMTTFELQKMSAGDQVTLTAQPNTDCAETSFTVDGAAVTSPYVLTVSGNHEVLATFASTVAATPVDPAQCAKCHVTASPGLYVAGTTSMAADSNYHTNGASQVQAMYTAGYATDVYDVDGNLVSTGDVENSCASCHSSTHKRLDILSDFANESGHGDPTGEAWIHYPWEDPSRASCQPCHTTTGFVNALTGSTDAAPGAEMLSCVGCHENGNGDLRAAPAYTADFGDGVTLDYPEIGASNLCVRCHTGRTSGENIASSTDDFSNTGFKNSHYLAAGGQVFAATGYVYGATPTGGYHENIGVDNNQATGTAGPCVTCHMGIDSADHSWDVVSLDEITGEITAINSNACINCHADLTPAELNAAKDAFHLALVDLKTALANNDIYFLPNYPYFFSDPAGGFANAVKDWTVGGTKVGKDVMGAAFNYNLFDHDPGAYAHNRGYALQLIADSIDYLADGIVDGSGMFGTENLMVNVEAAQEGRNLNGGHGTEFASVESTNVCAQCHSDLQATWATSAKANLDGSPSSGLRTASTEAASQAEADAGASVRVCQQCHAPNWEAPVGADMTAEDIAGAIGCAGCHEAAAPVHDSLATCGSCHDGTKFHGSHGGDELALVTASKHNNQDSHGLHQTRARCQRCHSTEGSIEFAEYTGGYDAMNASDGLFGDEHVEAPLCAACHEPHTSELREVANWDPNENGTADQFDLCTSCHTYYDENGAIVGSGSIASGSTGKFYHATAWYRTVPSTHYDNPATGYATSNAMIEGYVIREDSANPCFDCHGHELKTNTRYAGDLDGSSDYK
ncbi:MAG: hypothetical protein C0619_07865, partial [Desulfuromonas sp.]